MDVEVRNYYPEKLFSAIKRAKSVKKPTDFYSWLQDSINEFIPHMALLTVWGNFKNYNAQSSLHCDLMSEFNGINSIVIKGDSKDAHQCMTYLYQLWLDNNRQYYALNNFSASEFGCKLRRIFPQLPKDAKSLLVFGISDLQGEHDCFYVFFSNACKFQLASGVMASGLIDFIMPHIDHVLRKIKYTAPETIVTKPNLPPNLSALTEREMEVIDWIKVGKTNHEIALILNISENTVKSHLKRIYQKLNVSKRAQAVALLAKH